MRIKKKIKIDPFLILIALVILGGFAGFIIHTIYYTPKETIVTLKEELKESTRFIQTKPKNFNDSTIEERDFNYRKNWKDYISIGILHKDVEYTVSKDGRITSLLVPIINKTELPIESVTIRVYYIDPIKRNTLETRTFEIKNVPPDNHIIYQGPESSVKGVTVICTIIKVHSANFGLCYDQEMEMDSQSKGGFSGNPEDPWHCK